MSITMLKINIKNLDNFDDTCSSIDFITEKQVSSFELDEGIVTPLFNSVYKLNSLAFVGINASGKTTTMNILSCIFDIYFKNRRLDNEMSIVRYFSTTLSIETFLYDKDESAIYKVISVIEKDPIDNTMYFSSEKIYIKEVTQRTIKKSVFDFNDKQLYIDRSTITSEFLNREDSIFSAILNKKHKNYKSVIDLSWITGRNYMLHWNESLSTHFISYLDPSIEFLKKISNKDTSDSISRFKLKFKNSDKEINTDLLELDQYLSSGTIKGITLLSQVFEVLQTGGYLLVDEIENHFNKTLVTNIIRMFNSDINRNSATLLFTTHYSEILDNIDRSDSIYILNRNPQIQLNKYSSLAGAKDRIDKKKSDMILSGVLHTAPSYNAYLNLIQALNTALLENDKNDQN